MLAPIRIDRIERHIYHHKTRNGNLAQVDIVFENGLFQSAKGTDIDCGVCDNGLRDRRWWGLVADVAAEIKRLESQIVPVVRGEKIFDPPTEAECAECGICEDAATVYQQYNELHGEPGGVR